MSELEIITPNQYSLAWPVLAALSILTALFLIGLIIYLTRYFIELSAYKNRPKPLFAVKAEYLRVINQIEQRMANSKISSSQAHLEIEAALRSFVQRTKGLEVSSVSLRELIQDPRTRQMGLLIARIHEGAYYSFSDKQVSESARAAREVIRSWS